MPTCRPTVATALLALVALSLAVGACGGAQAVPPQTQTQPPTTAVAEPEPTPVDDTRFADGNAALAAGRLDDAARLYDRVITDDPEHVGALINRSIVLLALHQRDAAMADARAALALSPDDVDVRAHAIAVFARSGRCSQAEAIAHDAPELHVNRPDVAWVIAACDVLGGDPLSAIEILDALLLDTPLDADLLCLRGVAAEESENHIEALAFYNRALAATPSHLDALRNKGMLQARMGRNDDAVATLARWLELAPAAALDRPAVSGVLETLDSQVP